MIRSQRLALALGAVAVAISAVLVVAVARGLSSTPAPHPASPPPTAGGATSTPEGSGTAAPGLAIDPAGRARRVADILDSMHVHAFNPQAPPTKNSTLTGGLFINWLGTWDGDLATASTNTNLQTSGQSDDTTGSSPRHDPVTDLLYMRNLAGYSAAHPADHSFDADIDRIQPIVADEFARYTYYRCWVYFELRDLDRFQPQRGWDGMARNFAAAVYRGFYDQQAGTIIDHSHGSYRTDFAAECGAALLDAGKRYGDAGWSSAGASTISHLLANARDPRTHLFPLQMNAAAGGDTVKQAQIKLGSEAQLLDALLTAYDLAGDRQVLQAVHDAVVELYSPDLGLWDTRHGGFLFAVDASGGHLESAYKETRQAWMVALLEHLDRAEPGAWRSKAAEIVGIVENNLWQAPLSGYVYRVTPAFGVYGTQNGPNHTAVSENFVTTEAMGIAGQVLEGTGT